MGDGRDVRVSVSQGRPRWVKVQVLEVVTLLQVYERDVVVEETIRNTVLISHLTHMCIILRFVHDPCCFDLASGDMVTLSY